jgi:hypothetical protein
MRYEGAFRAKYVSPLGLSPTEEIARSISWGLMQVMGQVAREHGYVEKFLSALCDPEAGLATGCAVFAAKLALAEREVIDTRAPRAATTAPCISACKTAALGCVSIGGGHGLEASGGRTTTEVGSPVQFQIQHRALQLWNGGANSEYADQVLGRVARYR